MGLKERVSKIERQVGQFSTKYKTIENGHTYTIPFELKPAQQLLAALGGSHDSELLLSTPLNMKTSGNEDVSIKGFTPNTSDITLTISGKRLDRLFSSAKVYVNTELFPEGLYRKALKKKLPAKKKASLPEETKGIHWENLAVAVCHAQEVDLLVDTIMSSNHRAHTTVREGRIDENQPALLLLSSPHLDLSGSLGAHLDKKMQIRLIEAMYRNLFDAAQQEHRRYICLPAAGLGRHGGKSSRYFTALMNVAREFPDLNIIYHPGNHEKSFDKELKKAKLPHVAKASKNVIFMAEQLTKSGKSCALHIPSDSDVIYGMSDVGGHWKSPDSEHHHLGQVSKLFRDKKNETIQTYIGTVSTAALNSFGLNPKAYATIVERHLMPDHGINEPDLTDVSEEQSVEEEHSGVHRNSTESPSPLDPKNKSPNSSSEPNLPVIIPEDAIQDDPSGATSKPNESRSAKTPDKDRSPQPASEAPEPTALDKSKVIGFPSTSGIFAPGKSVELPTHPDPASSSLDEDQIREINQTINRLNAEIQSCWPYPNKGLKQLKIDALGALIHHADTMSIHDAIERVKGDYPEALKGSWSTRTADLLHKLVQSAATAKLG